MTTMTILGFQTYDVNAFAPPLNRRLDEESPPQHVCTRARPPIKSRSDASNVPVLKRTNVVCPVMTIRSSMENTTTVTP